MVVEVDVKAVGVTLSKAVLVAIGVPYGIAIIAHTATGWQQSDPKQNRFSKQLHPSRVLRLNYAIGHQFSAVKWLPLLARSKTFHKNTDQSLKNISFGQNGMKMDVWIPLAKYRKENVTSAVIFVYGGAWSSGYKEMYAKFGQEVANALGMPVVIPDYSLYPKGTMQDMVQDVVDSILETRRRSSDLSIKGSDVILIGHSAGAHLCMLAAIQLASKDYMTVLETTQNISNQELSNNVQGNVGKDPSSGQQDYGKNRVGEASDGKTGTFSGRESNLKDSNIQSSTFRDLNECEIENACKDSVEENVCDTDLVASVKGVIGIGGVYHIMDHYLHESKRAVEDISPMWRAAEGLENFERYSPALLVPQLSEEEKQRLPPHMLIHGKEDRVVPMSSSSSYSGILSEAGVSTQLKIVPKGGHGELIMDMMEPDRKWYSIMMGLVMEGVVSFLKENDN